MKKTLLFFLGFLFVSSGVQAMEVLALSGVNLASPSVAFAGVAQSTAMKYDFAGGFLFRLPLQSFHIESGALLTNRSYAQFAGAVETDLKFQTVVIPIVGRFSILKNLTLGIGGYFGFGIGNISSTAPGAVTSTTTTVNYGDPSNGNYSSTDLGVLAALGYSMVLGPKTYFVVEAFYLYGLANLTGITVNAVYQRNLIGMIGLKFSI